MIKKCHKCGLIFRYPQPTKDQIIAMYNNSYFKGSSIGYENYLGKEYEYRKIARVRLNLIENFNREKGRMLDIGCAYGFFLDEAKKRGWEVQGVDIAVSASNYARKKLHLKVYTSSLENFSKKRPGSSFDVITLWDVLEHFTNPTTALKQVNRLLKPGGFMFLTTVEVERLEEKILHIPSLWYSTPSHLHFFSRKVLVRLLKKSGFDVIYAGVSEKSSLFFILDEIVIFYYSLLEKIKKSAFKGNNISQFVIARKSLAI